MSYDPTRSRSERKQIVSENRQLRRENSRLRKLLQRLGSSVDAMSAPEEPIEPPKPPKPRAPGCPKCGADTDEVEFGRFRYWFCTSCDYRERKPG